MSRPRTWLLSVFSLNLCAILAPDLPAQISWINIGRDLAPPVVHMFAYNANGDLLAATTNGVLRYDSETSSAVAVLDARSSGLFSFSDGVMISVGDGV